MKRIAHIARSFRGADEWDIRQLTALPLARRVAIADELKRRAYGENSRGLKTCRFGRLMRRTSPRT
jgi:hypothetical protein